MGADPGFGSESGVGLDTRDTRDLQVLRGGGFEVGDPGYEDEDEDENEKEALVRGEQQESDRGGGVRGGKERRGEMKDIGRNAVPADSAAAAASLPPRPPQAATTASPATALAPTPPKGSGFGGDSVTLERSGVVISRIELNALRQGVRNQKGELVFFDTTFVEDPWRGLQPVELPKVPGMREGRG